MTPATKVPWLTLSSKDFSLVQFVRSFTFRKCGWFLVKPVSKIATLTPLPVMPSFQRTLAFSTEQTWRDRSISEFLFLKTPWAWRFTLVKLLSELCARIRRTLRCGTTLLMNGCDWILFKTNSINAASSSIVLKMSKSLGYCQAKLRRGIMVQPVA